MSAGQTAAGRYYCTLCDDTRADEYDSLEELWIEHCLKPLAAWTHESFTEDAKICLCRDGGSTAAFICSGIEKERIKARSDFFKEVPAKVASNKTASY